MSLLTDLLSYHKKDESSGDAADAHSNHTGTVTGATQGASGGILNTAYSYDGVGNFVSLANSTVYNFSPTDKWSVSLWANITDVSQIRYLVSKLHDGIIGSTAGWGFASLDNAGESKFQPFFALAADRDSSQFLQIHTTNTFAYGSLFHLVMTYGGNLAASVKIYVNGTSEALTTLTDDVLTTDTITHSETLRFGHRSKSGGSLHHKGIIDEIAIWGREITASEVTTLNNGGNALPFRSFGTMPANLSVEVVSQFRIPILT